LDGGLVFPFGAAGDADLATLKPMPEAAPVMRITLQDLQGTCLGVKVGWGGKKLGILVDHRAVVCISVGMERQRENKEKKKGKGGHLMLTPY
jgi:hypothetical protein